MKTILVQMSERQWTKQAVHLACALARNHHASVILLQLIAVRHPSYLGTAFGFAPMTDQEYEAIREYGATAEDYSVEFSLQPMQCVTSLDAVIDAAEQLDVDVVFAHVAESRFPFWRKFQLWNMRRCLSAHQRQLFTLDRSDSPADQLPTIITRPAHTVSR